MTSVPTVTLNNGVQMPLLGFGVYQISDAAECERSVADALETGYRLIDTAAAYRNEEAVGRAIQRSGVARDELFITTKVWVSDAGDAKTRKAFERSLEKLQVEYIDLYLLHQPYGDVYGAWRVMEDLTREGRIRAIGVSNFPPDRVMDFIVHQNIPPAVNQIETHPFHQQIDVHEFLRANHVLLESWGPFAEGRNHIFENEVLSGIGAKYRKSVAQVIVRWLIQRGVVAIPKSVRRERIIENFAVFDFELGAEDMAAIQALDTKTSAFFDHSDPAVVQRLSSYILS